MVAIYCDTADLAQMLRLGNKVAGWTCNPSIMRKAGVTDYEAFAREAIALFPSHPFSFEVIADDFDTMEAQARKIASWGINCFVKIPVSTTDGTFCGPLIARLAADGIKVNVTAVFTRRQVDRVFNVLGNDSHAIVSIFAGRIADTGVNPVEAVEYALRAALGTNVKVLWASTRQAYDAHHASYIGCDIITMTPDLIDKYLSLNGKDLAEYSRETVAMFVEDAKKAGLTL